MNEIMVVMMTIAYSRIKSDKRHFAGGMLFVNLLQLVNDRRFDTLQSTQISNLYKYHMYKLAISRNCCWLRRKAIV